MDKRLTRSVKERMIGGVCGGIANYFNIDPTIVRIGWAIVTLITNFIPGIVAYIVMLIVVPEESAVDPSASGSKPTTQKAKTQK
ncbi:PspC domain-containing protein [candidate division KSB1 bacterium]|nr:PspC domain-containing protein [candidate division KSB1 bacterium]NIR72835.1 PspC domain-containing protein [candidate division KSB1 bacterium]NIS26875.1 PspC domain-containing protein [candidate division KSB1 bacterium]NIT73671.1 PspC domain-containing protein [candidate division KSB1 bacterium]NIU27542.1 PspC domain-containing protein [candidate division KSB1 bacterium]